MSAVSSALSTLALEGYSIPEWFMEFLVVALFISLPLLCIRLFKAFHDLAKCQISESKEDT